MSDRLNELRRQRALIQQHADWLDRVIASSAASAIPVVPKPETMPPSAGLDPAAAIYTPDPIATAQQVRRGCLLYFLAAVILLAVILAAVVLVGYRDRPFFSMERNLPAENP